MKKILKAESKAAKVQSESLPVMKEEKIFSASVAVAIIAAILALNVLLFILASTFNLYIYSPEETDLSLTGATDSLFSEAIEKKKTVEIFFCASEDEVEDFDTGSYVLETVRNFQQRYPDFIKINFLNLITMRDKDGNSVDLDKYTEENEIITRGSVIFECVESGKFKLVTDYTTSSGYSDFYTLNSEGSAISYDGEEYVAAMIAWVLRDEQKKAYFTITHSEQVDPSFAKLLTIAGYESDTVNLREAPVPEDADLLIISNPKNDFETSVDGIATTEIGRIKSYLERGGNLYVCLDPYVKKLYSLEAMLAEYGLAISETEVDGEVIRDIVRDPVNAITTNGYTLVADHADGELATAIKENMDKYSDNDVIIREAGALALSGAAEAILVSSSYSTGENGGVVTRTEGNFPLAAYSSVPAGDGKEGRIFFASSVYMTVASALVTNGYANKDFVYSVFENVFGVTSLPYGCRSVLYETSTLENLTMSTAHLYTAIVLAVPAVIGITGAVIIIRRKNR